jgi:hypothetical protein
MVTCFPHITACRFYLTDQSIDQAFHQLLPQTILSDLQAADV